MKKALIVTTVSGFVPQFERNNVHILQKMGYEVHYASNFKNPHYGTDNHRLDGTNIVCHQVDFVRSPYQIRQNLLAYRQLKKVIEENEFQLVHCHTPMGGALARLAGSRKQKKQILRILYTAHGFHFFDGAPCINWLLYYPIERWLARYTDVLITINQEDYERAKRFCKKKKTKVEYIPGVGVDLDIFKRTGHETQEREKLGIDSQRFHIVAVGELNSNKNQTMILQAIASLRDKEVICSICGKGTSEAYLQKQIQKYGLEEQVSLLGYRSDISDILQTADCFIFCSEREGLGIAALEALACEVPVIASDNRGTREYMQHRKNGLVCMKFQPEVYAEAIRTLKESKGLIESMRSCCRKTAERFSIQETEKIMQIIYKREDSCF